MVEVLEFIFQDFWHWLGTLLLIGAIFLQLGLEIFVQNKRTKMTADKSKILFENNR